jgi:hypothetical protein
VSADKTRRPSTATEDNPLFHCSNLQGVILGVGLSMLEQLHSEQTQGVPKSASLPNDKTNKKRKVPDIATSEDMDEDEDAYYNTVASRGKKAKGGTGYAGSTKEDVSSTRWLFDVFYSTCLSSRLLAKQKLSQYNG